MKPTDHAVCASFYRKRAFAHVRQIIRIARAINEDGWMFDSGWHDAQRDEMDLQRWCAARDFKQAIADEQAAVRRAA